MEIVFFVAFTEYLFLAKLSFNLDHYFKNDANWGKLHILQILLIIIHTIVFIDFSHQQLHPSPLEILLFF